MPSINVNAYHQPGVEAGKKAAASVLALQANMLAALSTTPQTAEKIAGGLRVPAATESIYLLLEHLAANGRVRVADSGNPGSTTFLKQ